MQYVHFHIDVCMSPLFPFTVKQCHCDSVEQTVAMPMPFKPVVSLGTVIDGVIVSQNPNGRTDCDVLLRAVDITSVTLL
jgi:hypothetical protein